MLLLVMFHCAHQYSLYAQSGPIRVTFTGSDGPQYKQLERILVRNLTRDCDTLLVYPDTVITLGYTTIKGDYPKTNASFRLDIRPNPAKGEATVSLFTDKPGLITIRLLTLTGNVVTEITQNVQRGSHHFTLNPGNDPAYLLVAGLDDMISSVKVVTQPDHRSGTPGLAYAGPSYPGDLNKSTELTSSFTYLAGDRLLCAGYNDTLESGTIIIPDGEEQVNFQFAFNVPCPGAEIIEYGGKTYHTVQIFSQCWMKENLNLGTMIPGDVTMTDNQTIEKYCYNNIDDSCDVYGGFYQWDEMMEYSNVPGSRGICPPGWHIPGDDDWSILEGAADSYILIGDTSWNINGVRGIDCGFNLKSGFYWENDGNGSDIFGFTIPPAGYRDYWGYIYGFGHAAKYWSSDALSQAEALSRGLGCDGIDISRYNEDTANGYSVRCIKD